MTKSPHFNGHCSKWTWISCYQNISVLDFIGAKDEGCGGDNWRYKSAKLQSNCHHQQTNIQILQARCHSCRPTNIVEAVKG